MQPAALQPAAVEMPDGSVVKNWGQMVWTLALHQEAFLLVPVEPEVRPSEKMRSSWSTDTVSVAVVGVAA